MDRRDFIIAALLASASTVVFSKYPFIKKLFPHLYDPELKLLAEKLNEFKNYQVDSEMNELVYSVGCNLIGTPYAAGSLDRNPDEEKLVIMLSGLDCVTFVENTLTFSRLIKKKKLVVDSFTEELTGIRYRNGIITDYTSRLHYFSDWIYDNARKGIVENITKEIGGIPYDKKINFMTAHTDSYPALKKYPELSEKMKVIEKEINSREMYYIPKNYMSDDYGSLRNGDIVAITTDITGLDVVHTGIIHRDENNRIYLLHASSANPGKVCISDKELHNYLKKNKKQTGVMIARPFEL